MRMSSRTARYLEIVAEAQCGGHDFAQLLVAGGKGAARMEK